MTGWNVKCLSIREMQPGRICFQLTDMNVTYNMNIWYGIVDLNFLWLCTYSFNMADSFHNSGNILTVIQTGQVIMSVQSTTHLSLNSYWAKSEFCSLASSELGFQRCEEKRADSSRWLVPQKLRVSVCRGGNGHNAQSQF